MPAPFGFHSTDGGEVSGLVFDCKEEVSSSSIGRRMLGREWRQGKQKTTVTGQGLHVYFTNEVI